MALIHPCTHWPKSLSIFQSVGGEVVATADKLGDQPNPEDLIGLTKVVLDLHKNQDVDEVYLCSNRFVNTMTQQPTITQLIPLPAIEDEILLIHTGIIFMNRRLLNYLMAS